LAASLAIGGLFLLAMVAATVYGAATLPASARVPLHAGAPEYSYWLPKRAGLAIWLAVGALGFAVPGLLSASSLASNWTSSVRVTLTPAVMCVVLAFQAAALISARRRCTEPPAEPATAGDSPSAAGQP
jgi:hypothetical protein